MSLAPGKGVSQPDVVVGALQRILQEAATPLSEPSGKKQFDELVRQGREDLKRQEAISAYFQRLGLIQKGLIGRQKDLKPDAYFLEGLKQVIEEPVGAALIQNLLEDFPLLQTAATREQTAMQQVRLVAQPGTKTPEEWAAFQTLTVLGAFNLERAKAIVEPNPKNLAQAYGVYKQGNNRGAIANILRPIVSRILPK